MRQGGAKIGHDGLKMELPKAPQATLPKTLRTLFKSLSHDTRNERIWPFPPSNSIMPVAPRMLRGFPPMLRGFPPICRSVPTPTPPNPLK